MVRRNGHRYVGIVTSFDHPFWRLVYSDNDSEDMGFNDLRHQLLPEGCEYGELDRRYWCDLKAKYEAIRNHLTSDFIDLIDPNFLKRIFSHRKTSTV